MLKHTESTPPRPWINIKNKIKFSCCKTGALKISMKYITRNNCSSVTLWILLDLMVKDTHSSFFKKKLSLFKFQTKLWKVIFFNKSCNYNYKKKKKRIWDRIRLHYVGTTFGIECGAFTSMPSLYSRKITNQPLLEFDGNTIKKKKRNSTNCFAQPLNLEWTEAHHSAR